jgi:hypothetical protein
MDEIHSRGKILRGSEGVGTVTPQMIEERAREIARSDGRAQPNDLDRTRAREELTGATSNSEKFPTMEEPGRDWRMPLVSTGEKAPLRALKMTKTSPTNWFKKASRKPTTINA